MLLNEFDSNKNAVINPRFKKSATTKPILNGLPLRSI